MESGANIGQVLVDLWASILKLLGRPAIQQQLLIGLVAVLLAWLLARWIIHRMHRREVAQTEALRNEIQAEVQMQLAEIDRHQDAQQDAAAMPSLDEEPVENFVDLEERTALALLLQDDAALDEVVTERRGRNSRLRALIQQVLYPALAIVFLYAGYVYAVAAGWYSGLLVDLIVLFFFFLLYRLAFGVAYAFGDPERIAYYQHRLFGPLVVVIVFLLVLNVVSDLSTLSAARLWPLEQGWLTLGMLFTAVFGFYLWVMGLSLVKDLIQTIFGRRPNINAGSLDAGLTLIQYSLIALGFFTVISTLQVNTATIAAITGGLAIGVGFALQDVLKNFLGGIIVLFEGSVRPGDWVEIAGTEGAIDKLSIRSTVVRTFDNVEYIVPNQDWLNSTVTTFTRSSRLVRTRVPISVSYNADPHFVQALLVDVASQHPEVLDEPAPLAPLVNFGASSLDFLVLAWVEDAMVKGKVASELRMQIWDALAANDVEIPFPQQDIHIRSGAQPLLAGEPAIETRGAATAALEQDLSLDPHPQQEERQS